MIGGTPASPAEWGFAVAIGDPDGFVCTGSLIGPTKVLTAAHCITAPPTQMYVISGRTSLNGPGGSIHSVSASVMHPGYVPITGGRPALNDLAVLSLSTPGAVGPVTVASTAEDQVYTQPGATLRVAGFGTRNPVSFGKPKFGVLTTTQVSARFGGCGRGFDAATMICDAGARAGYASRGYKRRAVQRTVCFGDSGGPLLATTAAGPRLVGVASTVSSPPPGAPFGFVRCGLRGFRATHTRVAPNRFFIDPYVGK